MTCDCQPGECKTRSASAGRDWTKRGGDRRNPSLPKIALIGNVAHPGRYLQQQEVGGRWVIHTPEGEPVRELNSYESRFVSSAWEPAAVSRALQHDLGQAAWRVMQVERQNRELQAALADTEAELVKANERIQELEKAKWAVVNAGS